MNQHHSKHVFVQCGIETQRFADEIVNARDRFHAGESSSGCDECQQRAAQLSGAFSGGFFKMGDQTIAKVNRVAQRLHRKCSLLEYGKLKEIRYRSKADHKMIVR